MKMNVQQFSIGTIVVLALVGLASGNVFAQGFESAKTLPKGVRNIDFRTVNTSIDAKTNGAGEAEPLSKPLAQDLTFGKIAAGETNLKGNQLRAFLAANNFSEDEVVGTFSADLRGKLKVFAPIFAYGATDDITVAVAIPQYHAATSIEMGFTPTERAQAFLNTLADPSNNQTESAREAGRKLNDAVLNLNAKLADNGYRELEDWESQGPGDMTVATKVRFLNNTSLAAASTAGVVAPTGRTDDPDILNDIAFGDGQWDLFGQLAIDQYAGFGISFNEYVKYTHQLPGDKIVREVEDDEAIEVRKERSRFKLGDKIDAGVSAKYEPSFGLISGIGYSWFKKFGDVYRELSTETKGILETNSHQEAQNALYMIGYSTVPLYQAGTFKVPFEVKMTWSKQISSKNIPVSDLAQLDFNLFF